VTTFYYDMVRRIEAAKGEHPEQPLTFVYDTGGMRPAAIDPDLGCRTNMTYDAAPRADEPLIVKVHPGEGAEEQ
jgi:hypothetical protein